MISTEIQREPPSTCGKKGTKRDPVLSLQRARTLPHAAADQGEEQRDQRQLSPEESAKHGAEFRVAPARAAAAPKQENDRENLATERDPEERIDDRSARYARLARPPCHDSGTVTASRMISMRIAVMERTR